MDETNRDSPKDFHDFAEALVKKLIWRYQLDWDEHRTDDAVQDLFLAGWQVWCDTKDVGLAKNRMASRQRNLIRDYSNEKKHRPKFQNEFEPIFLPSLEEGKSDREDWLEQRAEIRGSPAEAGINDFLDHMPQRRRDICRYRMAGYTNEKIAQELGVSKRTIDRELSATRKDCKNEFGNH